MDDRIYLALYDERRIPEICRETGLEASSFIKELVLPGYELFELEGVTAIKKARFSEVSAGLYEPAAEILEKLDRLMEPGLKRHQAMAADDDRLYNVFVYVAEDE